MRAWRQRHESDGRASYFAIETGTCGLIFSANDQKGILHAQTDSEDASFVMLVHYPRPGTWAHVEATVHAVMNRIDVTVDGNPALVSPAILPAGCITQTSKLQLRPGLHCEPVATSPREVRLDNIVVVSSQN